jgi:ABC-2 type transport system ATP-binding protein
MPAIVVEGLERAFDQVLAVQGIDITVEEGEILGFLGPTGPARRPRCGC